MNLVSNSSLVIPTIPKPSFALEKSAQDGSKLLERVVDRMCHVKERSLSAEELWKLLRGCCGWNNPLDFMRF